MANETEKKVPEPKKVNISTFIQMTGGKSRAEVTFYVRHFQSKGELTVEEWSKLTNLKIKVD